MLSFQTNVILESQYFPYDRSKNNDFLEFEILHISQEYFDAVCETDEKQFIDYLINSGYWRDFWGRIDKNG